MRSNTLIRLTIGTLLVLQVATAVAGIVLLTRMAPAVRAILDENVRSLEAIEQMLLALAASTDEDRAARFAQALAQAEGNITEAEERPVLRAIRRHHQLALQGEPQALDQVLGQLARLAQINHRSMEQADQRAMRLGDAGAWAMAVLGMLCFGLSLWATRRAASQISLPLAHIHDAVAAFRKGDTLRRCHVPDAALEPAEIAAAVNQLLDQATARSSAAPPCPGLTSEQLLPLLEALPQPALLLRAEGQLAAANRQGLAALAADPTLRQQLREQQEGQGGPDTAQLLPLDQGVQLVLLPPSSGQDQDSA